MEIVPEAPSALKRLKEAGFVLIVVTNQPDVARGTTPLSVVESINDRLAQAMPVDAWEMCIHDDADNCDCRKPKPGMLTRSGARLNISLGSSAMVGDRWRDIEAGRAAGCRTILVGDGYGEKEIAAPDAKVLTIAEAAEWILGNLR
jgi:D-glycero-D-manno-heptose 1,7-bisphosphate phosphatase